MMPAVRRGGFQNGVAVRDDKQFIRRIIAAQRLPVEMPDGICLAAS